MQRDCRFESPVVLAPVYMGKVPVCSSVAHCSFGMGSNPAMLSMVQQSFGGTRWMLSALPEHPESSSTAAAWRGSFWGTTLHYG